MQRVRTAISGVLGSLGIALLVVGLALSMENTAAAKDEDGNFSTCVLCTNNCTYAPRPIDGCPGTCDGLLCGQSCGCRKSNKNPMACLCKAFVP